MDESLLKRRRVTITSAQVLALAGTPKELIPAPGPGKLIQVVDALLYNPAANHPAYVNQYAEPSAPDNLILEYGDGTDIAVLESTAGAIVSATEAYQRFVWAATITTVYSLVENSKVQLLNDSTDLTGGTNPVFVYLTYRILDTDTGSSGYIEEA